MLQATKRLSAQAVWMVLLAVAGAGAQAQSIADYSRAQRAVLEAEMARNRAKAMGGNVASATAPTALPGASPTAMPAPLPASAVPAPAKPPAAPFRERGMSVAGVIALTSRSMVELQNDGETHLLQQGDPVPGTPWVVTSIDPQRVVLKAGKSKTRTLPVPTGGH